MDTTDAYNAIKTAYSVTVTPRLSTLIIALYDQALILKSYRAWFGNPWRKLLKQAEQILLENLRSNTCYVSAATLQKCIEELEYASRFTNVIGYYSDERAVEVSRRYNTLVQHLIPLGVKPARINFQQISSSDLHAEITRLASIVKLLHINELETSAIDHALQEILGPERFATWVKLAS